MLQPPWPQRDTDTEAVSETSACTVAAEPYQCAALRQGIY